MNGVVEHCRRPRPQDCDRGGRRGRPRDEVRPAELETRDPGTPPEAARAVRAIPAGGGRRRSGTSARVALGGLVVVGLVALVGTERHVLDASVAAIGHLRWVWMLPAVVAGSLSLVALARMQRHLLAIGGAHLSTAAATATVYASNAISSTVPLAGTELGTAYAFRRYQQHGVNRVSAAWMLTVSGVVSSVTFGFIVSFSALASSNTAATFAGAAGTFGLAGAVAVLALSIRNASRRARIETLCVRVIQATQRATRHPGGDARLLVDTALREMAALRPARRDWLSITGAGCVNWLADALCLALAIKAVGVQVPWSHVLLVWAAGATVGTLRFTPGGLGIVEASMVAALVASGTPSEVAATSVLAYRLISFWIPLAIGWTVQLVPQPTTRRALAGAR